MNQISMIAGATVLLAALLYPIAKADQADHPFPVPAEQTSLTPTPGIRYVLSPGSSLFKANDPGPKESGTHQAWLVANEFILRTTLRNTCLVPSQSVKPLAPSGYLVFFTSSQGKEPLAVLIRADLSVEMKAGLI